MKALTTRHLFKTKTTIKIFKLRCKRAVRNIKRQVVASCLSTILTFGDTAFIQPSYYYIYPVDYIYPLAGNGRFTTRAVYGIIVMLRLGAHHTGLAASGANYSTPVAFFLPI